jgi:protein gp37
MADLFGDWVPAEWINEVLKTVKETPWHTFLFLTKNPKRYLEFQFPNNCWLGITLTGEEPTFQVAERSIILSDIKNVKFVSYEPLLKKPKCFPNNIDWLIIGGLTPKPVHENEWVKELIDLLRISEIPIFLKDNLKYPEIIKKYPKII